MRCGLHNREEHPLTRIIVPLFLLSLAFPALVRAEDPKDAKGTFVPTEMTVAGEKAPADQLSAIKLTVGDGKYKVEINNEGAENGTYTVDTSKKPVRMVITATDGPNKGKKILAITEVSDDMMKVCYDVEGKEYPTKFESTKDNKYLLVVYKKQK
jgi:uncharacterized protein (TIGR03067 family)